MALFFRSQQRNNGHIANTIIAEYCFGSGGVSYVAVVPCCRSGKMGTAFSHGRWHVPMK
jgi:hypothetical protein